MISAERIQNDELSSLMLLGRADVRVLTPEEERSLVLELDELRRLLAVEAANHEERSEGAEIDVQEFVRSLTTTNAPPSSDENLVLLSLAKRYAETRTKLAMANLRLVAHVARRYRDRGISTSDLLQEGFCGLLTAIDRYDVSNGARLASYAVWWIRQALQRAVAAGIYPVRLNPRHLQKLAESSNQIKDPTQAPVHRKSRSAEATLQQIYTATRPSVSLDAPIRDSNGVSLLDTLSSPSPDEADEFDREERLSSLIEHLKPRERTVLELRFGLNGGECHSLSQVSGVLNVSKERIRQIQDGALAKLRILAQRDRACCEAV